MKLESYHELLTETKKSYEGFINITNDETHLELNASKMSLLHDCSETQLHSVSLRRVWAHLAYL